MPRVRTVAVGILLLAIGYVFGAGGLTFPLARAQETPDGVTDEVATKIRDANRRLADAMEALQSVGRYESITQGVNSFLVLTGGGNARQDLESGRGVDPETFAALYAGQALPEIQALLGTDDQDRITYNNQVVRMYSKSRLQQLFEMRTKILESL